MNLRDALQTDWGVLLAGMTISAAPLIILFLLMQKQFIRGMTAGSGQGLRERNGGTRQWLEK